MASKDSDEPRFQVHQIVLLIAAMAGGIWLYEGPLKSSRPVAHDIENKSAVTSGADRVQARLWQDPFEAVEIHVKSEKSKNSGSSARGEIAHSHSLTLVAEEVARSTPTPGVIQILIILTDGSPYAANRESLLRQRYAVLAGLERAGYAPLDSEHIRFFRWDESEICQSASARHHLTFSMLVQQSQLTLEINDQALSSRKDDCTPMANGHWHQTPVPVDWYQSVNGGTSHVLVFWIKDQDLGVKPVASLRTIRRMTLKTFPLVRKANSFKVIGPRFSGTLRDMIAEGEANKEVKKDIPIEIYSPWSTAPEETFSPGKEKLEDRLKWEKVKFIRTIPTDTDLMATLADELKRRGVAVGDECAKKEATCDHIAVIAEGDTFYGRTLPLTFSAVVTDQSAATDSKQFQKTFNELRANPDKAEFIHRYSYLGGLDGELPQSKSNNSSGSSSNDTASSSALPNERRQDIERMERPEGRSQLDYVRRLAQFLRTKEDELRGKCVLWKSKCHGFKAIGVLGSDIYDKLLILQALRKSFPYVIFFTTDLDARLYHPSELAWTRNLVVASHFDLRLHEKLQGTIPPFRDTYQTATFFTVLRALDVLEESASRQAGSPDDKTTIRSFHLDGDTKGDNFEAVPRVKLHEIGRNGPVDISVNKYRHDIDQAQSLEPISTVRAAPENSDDTLKTICYLIFFSLIFGLLLITSSVTISKLLAGLLNSEPSKRIEILFICFAGALGLFAMLLLLHLYLTSDAYSGEPFSLFDGVSIWPSQLIRGTVIGLALLFGWLLLWYSKHLCDVMEEQFRDPLELQPSPSNRPSSLIDSIKQWWEADKPKMFIGAWDLDKEANAPEKLWREYRERLHWTWILMRVVPVSVMFILLGQVVLAITGLPFTPFRGDVANHVNLILLQLAVVVMIGVIFLVLDITQLTSVFIKKLVPKNIGKQSSPSPLTRLRLVEQLTDHIDEFIYCPAALLVLMVTARSEFIDNWDFPIGLMVVVGLSASYVVVSAIQLRRASECARERVIDALSAQQLKSLPSDSVDKIRQSIEEVKALSKGAFMPITELPVFRAVTLPTGFYAVLTLVETFIKN